MNCNNYSLTDHAKSRIISRFNIKNASQLDWAKNVLKQSKRKAKAGHGRIIYTTGSIDTVIDETSHEIITIYPHSNNEIDKEFQNIRELNLFTYNELRSFARSRYRVELRKSANKLQARYFEIANLYKKLVHTQSQELMQAKLDDINDIQQDIDMISNRLSDYLDFVKRL